MSVDFDEDIISEKLTAITDNVDQIRRVADDAELERWMIDDLCTLYVQRAVDACIDVANHLIAANGWKGGTTA